MKAKTYTANSIQRALDQIKSDAGPDALILSTQEITSRRVLGLIRQRKWVVTAAVSESETPSAQAATVPQQVEARRADAPAATDNDQRRFRRNLLQHRAPAPAHAAPAAPAPAAPNGAISAPPPGVTTPRIAQRLKSSDSRLEELLQEVSGLKRKLDWISKGIPEEAPSTGGVYGELVVQGFDPEVAEHVVELAGRGKPSVADFRNRVRAAMAEMLSVERPVEFFGRNRIISLFAGPAGVGKTTTVAKVAGYAKAQYGKRVAMISMDPFPTAGCSPLMRFADLLDIAAYTCTDMTSLNRLLGILEDDLILIDTAGVGANDHARLSAIKAIVGTSNARLHLLSSAATRAVEMTSLHKQFADVPHVQMLITKADEAESKGAFVSDLLKNEMTVSFITDGQSVPERLWSPSAEDLANYVLPLETVEVAAAAL